MLRETNFLLLIVFNFTMLYLIMVYITVTLDLIDDFLDYVNFHVIIDILSMI